jgi:CheY-like chemotaxis protein
VKVLVADDDADVRDSTQMLLVALGNEVDVVGRHDEIVPAARAGPYDVVLLDVGIPDMDLDRTVEALRDSDCHGAAVVLFTANVEGQDLADRIGAEGLLKKPFDPSTVQKTLQAFIQKSK